MSEARPRVAVVLPCHNEETAIAGVVAAFRAALPEAAVYVYDNASRDRTAAVAREAGAIVRSEPRRGKGQAVRRAFADIEADIYVMADGDGTYDAAAAPRMIEALCAGPLDMVVGVRVPAVAGAAAYRPGHQIGNRAFSALFRRLFKMEMTDLLSGYRVLSRRFVKSFPSVSKGFEIELEISTHAALLRAPSAEVETRYGERAQGSRSKLNTWSDGWRILRRMLTFLRLHRPLFVFGAIAFAGAYLSLLLALPVVVDFLRTGLVPRIPTAILSTGIMLAAITSGVLGLILDHQARYFAEMKRLAYLQMPPPPSAGESAPLEPAGIASTWMAVARRR